MSAAASSTKKRKGGRSSSSEHRPNKGSRSNKAEHTTILGDASSTQPVNATMRSIHTTATVGKEKTQKKADLMPNAEDASNKGPSISKTDADIKKSAVLSRVHLKVSAPGKKNKDVAVFPWEILHTHSHPPTTLDRDVVRLNQNNVRIVSVPRTLDSQKFEPFQCNACHMIHRTCDFTALVTCLSRHRICRTCRSSSMPVVDPTDLDTRLKMQVSKGNISIEQVREQQTKFRAIEDDISGRAIQRKEWRVCPVHDCDNVFWHDSKTMVYRSVQRPAPFVYYMDEHKAAFDREPKTAMEEYRKLSKEERQKYEDLANKAYLEHHDKREKDSNLVGIGSTIVACPSVDCSWRGTWNTTYSHSCRFVKPHHCLIGKVWIHPQHVRYHAKVCPSMCRYCRSLVPCSMWTLHLDHCPQRHVSCHAYTKLAAMSNTADSASQKRAKPCKYHFPLGGLAHHVAVETVPTPLVSTVANPATLAPTAAASSVTSFATCSLSVASSSSVSSSSSVLSSSVSSSSSTSQVVKMHDDKDEDASSETSAAKRRELKRSRRNNSAFTPPQQLVTRGQWLLWSPFLAPGALANACKRWMPNCLLPELKTNVAQYLGREGGVLQPWRLAIAISNEENRRVLIRVLTTGQEVLISWQEAYIGRMQMRPFLNWKTYMFPGNIATLNSVMGTFCLQSDWCRENISTVATVPVEKAQDGTLVCAAPDRYKHKRYHRFTIRDFMFDPEEPDTHSMVAITMWNVQVPNSTPFAKVDPNRLWQPFVPDSLRTKSDVIRCDQDDEKSRRWTLCDVNESLSVLILQNTLHKRCSMCEGLVWSGMVIRLRAPGARIQTEESWQLSLNVTGSVSLQRVSATPYNTIQYKTLRDWVQDMTSTARYETNAWLRACIPLPSTKQQQQPDVLPGQKQDESQKVPPEVRQLVVPEPMRLVWENMFKASEYIVRHRFYPVPQIPLTLDARPRTRQLPSDDIASNGCISPNLWLQRLRTLLQLPPLTYREQDGTDDVSDSDEDKQD